jgi:predicted dehydrogenase
MKQHIKKQYGALKRYLPPPLRREIEGYLNYRRKRRERPAPPPPAPEYRFPYWERREKSAPGKRPLYLGIIGAGQYAQHHLKVLSALENVEVSAILSTGAPRLYQTAEKFKIPHVFTDIDAFLDREVDAYVIVASAQYMMMLALRCLATGRPVLLEKPAGVSSADTLKLVEQAERFQTFGMVGMNRRFYSVIEHGLAALADWGPIRGVMLEVPQAITLERQSKRLSPWDYDHFLFRNSIHGIDLVRYILGDPRHVHSLARPNADTMNAGASFASILEYDRGVTATITDLWDTPQVWRIKIVAEGGWLELEPLEVGTLYRNKGKKIPVKSDPIDQEFHTGIYAQDLHFVRAVRAGRKPSLPASLLPDALKTMQLIEQIQTSTVEQAQPLEASSTLWNRTGSYAQ